MIPSRKLTLTSLVATAAFLAACDNGPANDTAEADAGMQSPLAERASAPGGNTTTDTTESDARLTSEQRALGGPAVLVDPEPRAKALLQPTVGNEVRGEVSFLIAQNNNGVYVQARIEGLQEGLHGFHVHENGDCSAPDASSAGGHFNPGGTEHGARTDTERHVGDLGNIEANANGVATLDIHDYKLDYTGEFSLVGKAVVVHAEPDDLQSQPSGNAGDRVACGVIEAVQPGAVEALGESESTR